MNELWFRRVPMNGRQARMRLMCFPYAGGSASIFRQWAPQLPGIEICLVNLPGRGVRIAEPPCRSWRELADALATAWSGQPDVPFAIYGHSLGALVAFEVTRELRRRGLPQPQHLFVAAYRAPQLGRRHPPLHGLPDREFIDTVARRHNGIPGALLDDPELLQLLTGVLRADYYLHETYH